MTELVISNLLSDKVFPSILVTTTLALFSLFPSTLILKSPLVGLGKIDTLRSFDTFEIPTLYLRNLHSRDLGFGGLATALKPLETARQIEGRMVKRNYQGFIQ